MKTFFRLGISLMTLATCAAAQGVIPDAEPVEDGPLVANPEQDTMALGDTFYKQAQDPKIKADRRQYTRLLELSLARYQEVVERYPRSTNAPMAKYRAAICLLDLQRKDEANILFRDLVENGSASLASAAAYRLASAANAAGLKKDAIQYYRIVVQKTDQPALLVDAQYRMGRLFLSMNEKESAATMFSAIIGNKDADPKFVLAARMGYAALCADSGRLGEAYAEYRKVIDMQKVDASNRGHAILQAANLANRLKKYEEARALYEILVTDKSLKKMASEGQLGLLMELYRTEKYKELLAQYEKHKDLALTDKGRRVKLQMLLGQTAYKLKEYEKAANFFLETERLVPHTEESMKASFYRLLCYKETNQKDLPQRAQNFLNHYAKAYPNSHLHDMVRVIAAESLFATSPADAAVFYASIDFDKLPAEMRPNILYKSAWALAQAGNRGEAVILLTKFIEQFPQDKRVCESYVLRGNMNALIRKEAEALQDFDLVINRWPKNESASVAWQRAAQIYAARQDLINMAKYYEGLIKNFPNASPAALAEAHFLLGRADFERGEYKTAIDHLTEAKTLDAQKYGEQSNLLTVVSYHKLQDYEKLKDSLELLQKEHPEAASRVPDVVPAWLGIQAYGRKDLEDADKYLTWSTRNDQLQNVKKGIWRTLAKVRLALKKYDRALVAADNYLKAEEHPFRRADCMLDKASIQLGLCKYTDARKTAEDALALGVEGRLMALLKIVLGDISFAEKKYDEAAKYYGVTAELFVNDAELKPQAFHKTAEALEKAGRKSEASQYRARLHKEFPDWKPTNESVTTSTN